MIRLIIVVLFVVLFLILSIPIMFIEWIIGKFNPGVKDRSSLAIVNWAFRVARVTGYIAKKEIEKVPLLRNWMRNLHCLFLDRKDIKAGLKTILEAIELMKCGISICIFPEGTRNKVADTFLPFHEGSFKIAQKANCPIVPITINNSAAVLEDHFPKIRKAHVVVEYGRPIYINELAPENKKQLAPYVQQIISDTYFKNKEKYAELMAK